MTKKLACVIGIALVFAACHGGGGGGASPGSAGRSVHAIAVSPDGITCLPNDALDDRACAQAQLDALCLIGGGRLHFDTGTYLFTQDPTPGTRYNAGLRIECPQIWVDGNGFATILMMYGDANNEAFSGIKVTADPTSHLPTENVHISDLTVSSAQAYNTEEQTHTIHLSGVFGAVSAVFINHVRLVNSIRPEGAAGDCIRMVGEPTTATTGRVTFVDVGDVVMEECHRSGYAIQRSSGDVTIHDSLLRHIGKSPFDFEPTGSGPVEKFTIRGNLIEGDGVSLAGQAAERSLDLEFIGNTLRGGKLGIIYVKRAVVVGNTIEGVIDSGDGVINVSAVDELEVSSNHAWRLAGSAAGPVVKIGGSNGAFPGRITINSNHLTTDVAGSPIDGESVQDMTASDNDILSTAAAPGSGSAGIRVRATGRDLDRLQFNDNRIKGAFTYGVSVAGNPAFVGVVQVNGNMSSGPTSAGLRCENPAKFLKPVVASGNYWDGASVASSCSTVSVVTQRP